MQTQNIYCMAIFTNLNLELTECKGGSVKQYTNNAYYYYIIAKPTYYIHIDQKLEYILCYLVS